MTRQGRALRAERKGREEGRGRAGGRVGQGRSKQKTRSKPGPEPAKTAHPNSIHLLSTKPQPYSEAQSPKETALLDNPRFRLPEYWAAGVYNVWFRNLLFMVTGPPATTHFFLEALNHCGSAFSLRRTGLRFDCRAL